MILCDIAVYNIINTIFKYIQSTSTHKCIGYYDDLNTQQLNEMEKYFAKKLRYIREKYVYNKSANSEKCAKI